jgi:hypothetical protein
MIFLPTLALEQSGVKSEHSLLLEGFRSLKFVAINGAKWTRGFYMVRTA